MNHEDLLTELLFRGCNEDEVKLMGINARKTKLKDLEIIRVSTTDEDDETKKKASATAQKAFKPLSAALFNMNTAA